MNFSIEMMMYQDNIYTNKPVHYYGIAFKEHNFYKHLKPANDDIFLKSSNDKSD